MCLENMNNYLVDRDFSKSRKYMKPSFELLSAHLRQASHYMILSLRQPLMAPNDADVVTPLR